MDVRARRRLTRRATRPQAIRPHLEALEGRLLLYATTGMQWPKPKLLSYSFVPDGTSIGGVPSNLQATLNASFSTASWQGQFNKAASAWQKMANVNFSPVSDNGAALGISGNMQNDSRFGDIRIGGYPMSGSILAFAYLPPPANGGTSAGDIFLNTNVSWQINGTTYDLMTVAIHEFGHALGMGHSATSTAVMWPSYTSSKQVLTTDDVSGIRSIYNSRQNDFFDAMGSNDQVSAADDISSYIGSNGQLTLSSLDSTTPLMIGTNDIDWYKITVPASTTGNMVVNMQSSRLSLLSPWLGVYKSGGTTMLGSASSTAWGDTVTVTIANVSPGQVYDIKAKGATTGDSGFGAYGLQVNFGSLTQPPVTAPDTTMTEQADQGGGTLAETSSGSDSGDGTPQDVSSEIPGVPTYWVYNDGTSTVSEDNGVIGPDYSGDGADSTPVPDSSMPLVGNEIQVGDVSGLGDALMINAQDDIRLDQGTYKGVMPWTPAWHPARLAVAPPSAFGTSPTNPSLLTPLDFAYDSGVGDGLKAGTMDVTSGLDEDISLQRHSAIDPQAVADESRSIVVSRERPLVMAPEATWVEQVPQADAIPSETETPEGIGTQEVGPGVIDVGAPACIENRSTTINVGDFGGLSDQALEAIPHGTPVGRSSRAVTVLESGSEMGPDRGMPPIATDPSAARTPRVAVIRAPMNVQDRSIEEVSYEAVDCAIDARKPAPSE